VARTAEKSLHGFDRVSAARPRSDGAEARWASR